MPPCIIATISIIKWGGGGIRGRSECFQKFIRFGSGILPVKISSLKTGHHTWCLWPASPSPELAAAGLLSICSSSTFCALRVITKVGNDDWLIISISLQLPSSGCKDSPKRVEDKSVFEVLLLPSKYISFSYMSSFPFDWDSWINDRCKGYWVKLPLSIHHHEPEHTSAEWGCKLASWLVRASNTWDNFKYSPTLNQ